MQAPKLHTTMIDLKDLAEKSQEDLLDFARDLIDNYLIDKCNYTREQIGAKLAKHPTWVSKLKNPLNYKGKEKRYNRAKELGLILDAFKLKVHNAHSPYTFQSQDLEEKAGLKELAVKLACNLVDVSTSFGEGNKPHQEIIKSDLLDEFRRSTNRERFILITGAGVSFSATKGVIPLSENAINEIQKDVIDKIEILEDGTSVKSGIPQRIVDDELDYITMSTNLERDEFETQLLAYSKFAPVDVKKGLKKMCEPKHIPNLEYEILGHMVKHRAIDVVFDFNIDELFETVLIEEIAFGDFKNIYTDGHCPDDYTDLLVGNRIKQPVYIKPHGTIKHSSTLRFTRESLSKVPVKIRTLMTDILNAKLPHAVSTNQPNLRINFVIVGFGMKSPLLIESIKKYLDNPERIEDPYFWFFDKKKDLSEFKLALNPKHKEVFEKNHTIFPIDEIDSLPEYLKTLWGLIEDSFQEKYNKTKGIERHLLLNEIFDLSEEEIKREKEETLAFLYDRILVELFISILTSDGLLLSKRILEGRLGMYLKRLNVLEERKSPTTNRTTLRGICKQLGLIPYKDFIGNAFTLEPPNLFYKEDFIPKLYKKLQKAFSSVERKYALDEEGRKNRIIKIANKLKERNSLNINPQFTNPYRDVFSFIKDDHVLSTSLSWRYQYRQVLEKSNWDLMLAISEKGRILPKEKLEVEKMFKGKRLELILSSFNLPEDFEDVDPRRENIKGLNDSRILLSGVPQFLPWWLHNQHMIIFLKRKANHERYKNHRDKWEILDSFYYESRMLDKSVNPVMITGKEDKNELLNIYGNYWYRAKEYTKQRGDAADTPRRIHIIPHKDFLDKQIENLLSLYDTKLDKNPHP